MANAKKERWAHILPRLQKDRFSLIHHENLKSVAPHSHVFFELSYVLDGTVEHAIGDKKSLLKKGDYFLVDYGSYHSYRTSEKGFENIDCLFLPEFLDPALKGRENLTDLFRHYLFNYNTNLLSQNPSQMVFSDPDGKILTILKEIKKEWEEKEAGYREMVRCHLVQILLLTLRRLSDASFASGTQKISSFLCNFVTAHYREPISLTELSAEMNYSLPYVSKCFKEEMGVTFVEYLQEYRIREASRLLLSEKDSIPRIAEKVGYRDVKFFSALFKEIIGTSPAAFRKQNR